MEVYRIEGENAPAWLYKAYDYVRMDAFVFGQNIPLEMEFGHDEPVETLEAVVLTEDHKPIAGCRITYPRDDIGKIGRVCVIRDRQRSGVGHILIEEAEKWIREKGYRHIVINSQDRAAAFYKKCGYYLVPDVDPEIYENHPPRMQNEEEKQKHRAEMGFSCVLVEKYLD
ncbi:MAG: GNAT family N-acetyltransferase [Lachnoclostridium sp.]|nr:GNAT family N-acetyltransferase [Lachnospira sp.]MCM1248234.1 GNAT family N-acetyltransferase [Lachnoclostridium sp.]MCM1534978.1 GNAT family N-acetyltransferase [Clostridium sp.]